MKKLLLLLTVTLSLSSCYTSEIYCGGMTKEQAKVKIYSNSNPHLIYGLIPLGKGDNAQKVVGDKPSYMIQTQHTFVDGLLEFITCGIYSPTTTSVYLPYDNK